MTYQMLLSGSSHGHKLSLFDLPNTYVHEYCVNDLKFNIVILFITK